MEYQLKVDVNQYNNIYKIEGNFYVNIKPYSFVIDFYSPNGALGKIGRKINIDFNNIESTTKFSFDSKMNQVSLISDLNIEEYYIKTQYYEERIIYNENDYFGIRFFSPFSTYRIDIETPDNEKYYRVNSKYEYNVENFYY